MACKTMKALLVGIPVILAGLGLTSCTSDQVMTTSADQPLMVATSSSPPDVSEMRLNRMRKYHGDKLERLDEDRERPSISREEAMSRARSGQLVRDSDDLKVEASLVSLTVGGRLPPGSPVESRVDEFRYFQRKAWLVLLGDGDIDVPVLGGVPESHDSGGRLTKPETFDSYKASWFAYIDSATGKIFRIGSI